MLRTLLSRTIDGLEKTWAYDATYMRQLLAVSPWAYIKFGLVASLGHRPGAPAAAKAAAGIVGTLSEDCGPCTQISIDVATKSGVDPAVLRAVLAGDEPAMGADALLAYRFAHASLTRDMVRADPLRDEIVRRWGEKGLVTIALALTMARMYPTLKYALGHGRVCSKLVVAGALAPFHRAQPRAV